MRGWGTGVNLWFRFRSDRRDPSAAPGDPGRSEGPFELERAAMAAGAEPTVASVPF